MVNLFKNDCIKHMETMGDSSVDLILCDLPYTMTTCAWDKPISLEKMWAQVKRIRKKNAPTLLFGIEPFASKLRMSNIGEYKYDWYWDKIIVTGHLNAKKQPMRCIETISVFYGRQPKYTPIMTKGTPYSNKNRKSKKREAGTSVYGNFMNGSLYTNSDHNGERYPRQIIKVTGIRLGSIHQTQKPVDLIKYLIETYTQIHDTVIDFTCGSGTTAVACQITGRNCIAIDNGICQRENVVNGIQLKGKPWVEITKLRLNGKI